MANEPSVAGSSSSTSALDSSTTDSPTEASPRDWNSTKAPHLPFRRISLPPSNNASLFPSSSSSHRVSVASALSFTSLSEEGGMIGPKMPQSDAFSSSVRAASRLSDYNVPRQRPNSSGSLSSIDLTSKLKAARHSRPSRSQRSRSQIGGSRPFDEVQNTKRLKVMNELWETEKAYVGGLDLIYSHFLTPLISSLSDTNPILSREDLATLFSNFVDIWNLHRSLLTHLDEFFAHMQLARTNAPNDTTISESSFLVPNRPLSAISAASSGTYHNNAINDFLRILLAHFPYLSMYNPFVTAFPSSLSLLTALSTPSPSLLHSAFPRPVSSVRTYDHSFATWLKMKEADPLCRRLKLRDWMLSIIQRCPRYLLLIKELLSYTDIQDPEYKVLLEVTRLTTKVTNTLNDSLAAHGQIMSLISLQKATPNLPFTLIVPGRALLRRATMMKVDRGSDRRVRDVLLFSDCLIWISRGGEREDWGVLGEWASVGLETGQSVLRDSVISDSRNSKLKLGVGFGMPASPSQGIRQTGRIRSRSDADAFPVALRPSSSANVFPPPDPSLLRPVSVSGDENGEERWWYRGRVELLDIEVVISPIISSPGEERMLEVLSPEGSFTLYAESQRERDAWVDAIRSAKAARLASFQITHPGTTLTSSSSNAHVRRALQALPHDPASTCAGNAVGNSFSKKSAGDQLPRRGKVDHFVPAIWVPDQKTETCMRCNSRFGWRRRRHHCRLCGRVVCAGCSEKTFYITDASGHSKASTPARACNACYEAVFPLLPEPSEDNGTLKESISAHGVLNALHGPKAPPSRSMPSLALATPPLTTPMLTSTSSFSTRIRNASLFRKKAVQKLDHISSPSEPPSTSHSHVSSASTTEDRSQHLSSTGEFGSMLIPSVPGSPTADMLLAFPTVSEIEPPSVDQASVTLRTAGSDTEGQNDTVQPKRAHQRSSHASVQAVVFDPDATPRPTARRQNRWSIAIHPASLPTPDFSVTAAGRKDEPTDSHSRTSDVNKTSGAVPDLPNDSPRAAALARPSDEKFGHQKRPERRFKKRISIAPFPSPILQPLSVHDTPVTARTRVHGDGKSRRFSLMLGTIRGQAQGIPKSPSRIRNPRGGTETPRKPDDVGAWTIERAAQAALSDVETAPPSKRSHGVAISKLAELLGRDRGLAER